MSDSTVAVGSSGVTLGGLVFVVLLVLKLTGLAQVSWFWVFFPLWFGFALFIAAMAAIAALVAVVAGIKALLKK
jgi:hypothetical protein